MRTESLKSQDTIAHTFANIKEKILIFDEENETERTKRRADKHKTTFRFNAELGRQAESEVQTLRELKAEDAWIFQSITLGAAQSKELE
jgi:hypothetical protein